MYSLIYNITIYVKSNTMVQLEEEGEVLAHPSSKLAPLIFFAPNYYCFSEIII